MKDFFSEGCGLSHFRHLRYAALTDVGLRRKNNEDAFTILPLAGVFVVSDGMGGGAEGEFASAATVTAVQEAFQGEEGQPLDAPCSIAFKTKLIEGACNEASAIIQQRLAESGAEQMGATVVVACFDVEKPHVAHILHAGDSRAYRFRNGELTLLSKDHSVTEAVGAKADSDVPAMFRGLLTRAVGLSRKVKLDATPFEVRTNDRIVVCSDGLSHMASDSLIEQTLQTLTAEPVKAVTEGLVRLALEKGGRDNVTVVVIELIELPPKVMPRDPAHRFTEAETNPPVEADTVDTATETFEPSTPSSESTDPHFAPPESGGRSFFPGLSHWLGQKSHALWLSTAVLLAAVPAMVFLFKLLFSQPPPAKAQEHSGGSLQAEYESVDDTPHVDEFDVLDVEPVIALEKVAAKPMPEPASLTVATSEIDDDPTPIRSYYREEGVEVWEEIIPDNETKELIGGTYQIRFSREGYLTQQASIALSEGEALVVEPPDGWEPEPPLAALFQLENHLASNEENNMDVLVGIWNSISSQDWVSRFHQERAARVKDKIDELVTAAATPAATVFHWLIPSPNWYGERTPVIELQNDEGDIFFVDGKRSGMTELPPGMYVLKAVLPGFDQIEQRLNLDGPVFEWVLPVEHDWQPSPGYQSLTEAKRLKEDGQWQAADLKLREMESNLEQIDQYVRSEMQALQSVLGAESATKQAESLLREALRDNHWDKLANWLNLNGESVNLKSLPPGFSDWIELIYALQGDNADHLVEGHRQALRQWETALMPGQGKPPSSTSASDDPLGFLPELRQRSEALSLLLLSWRTLAQATGEVLTGQSKDSYEFYLWILKEMANLNPADGMWETLQRVSDFSHRPAAIAQIASYPAMDSEAPEFLLWTLIEDSPENFSGDLLRDFWSGQDRLLLSARWDFLGMRRAQIRTPDERWKRLRSDLGIIEEKALRYREQFGGSDHPFCPEEWTRTGRIDAISEFILLFGDSDVSGDGR